MATESRKPWGFIEWAGYSLEEARDLAAWHRYMYAR